MRVIRREDSVFLNCPFDPEYKPLFDAIAFIVVLAGYKLRCATERSDAGEQRLTKIIELIKASRYSIHDLSRTELDRSSGLPRFNMPIEVGIALGAKHLGTKTQRDHQMLVLDKEKYAYQKSASDLAGADIRAHANDQEKAIRAVRDFLSDHGNKGALKGADFFITAFRAYEALLPRLLADQHQKREDMTFVDQLRRIEQFTDSQADRP